MEIFWRHSLYTACACKLLAVDREVGLPGDLFMVGLMHDLGRLVLLGSVPVQYSDILRGTEAGENSWDLERDLFGFDHAEVGAELFRAWNFPDLIIQLTQEHHLNHENEAQQSLAGLRGGVGLCRGWSRSVLPLGRLCFRRWLHF